MGPLGKTDSTGTPIYVLYFFLMYYMSIQLIYLLIFFSILTDPLEMVNAQKKLEKESVASKGRVRGFEPRSTRTRKGSQNH